MNTLSYILKKYDLNSSDKVEIKNAGRDELARLFCELNYKIGAEIGVEKGKYSEILCKTNPQAKIYGIDPWESIKSARKNSPERMTENHSSQEKCNKYYQEALSRLNPYPKYNIIKEYSVDAVKKFDDESLDFVYIDANHQYSFITNDIVWWSKKIKRGGIVSGHDYYNSKSDEKRNIQTKRAVDDYVKNNNIRPLIIWGLDSVPSDSRGRGAKSWMWIKQ